MKLVYETVHVLKPANLGKVLYIIEPRYAWILQVKGFEFPMPQNLKRYTRSGSCMYISLLSIHNITIFCGKYITTWPILPAILEHFLKWCVFAAYFLQKKNLHRFLAWCTWMKGTYSLANSDSKPMMTSLTAMSWPSGWSRSHTPLLEKETSKGWIAVSRTQGVTWTIKLLVCLWS